MDPSDTPGSSKTDPKKKKTRRSKNKNNNSTEAQAAVILPVVEEQSVPEWRTQQKSMKQKTEENKLKSQQNASNSQQTNKKKWNPANKMDSQRSSQSSQGQHENSYQQSQPGSSRSKNYKNQKKNFGNQNRKLEQIKFTGFVESEEAVNYCLLDPVYVGIDTGGMYSVLFTDMYDVEDGDFQNLPLNHDGIKAMFEEISFRLRHPIIWTTIGVNPSHNNEMLKRFVEYGNNCNFNKIHLINFPTVALFSIAYLEDKNYGNLANLKNLPPKFVVITNFHVIGQIWELNIDGKYYPIKTCLNSSNNTTANLIKLRTEFSNEIDSRIPFYISESIPERLFASVFPENPFRTFFFQPSMMSKQILSKCRIIVEEIFPDTVFTLNRCLEIRLNDKVFKNFYCGHVLPFEETFKVKTETSDNNKLIIREIDSYLPQFPEKCNTVFSLPKSTDLNIKFSVNRNDVISVEVFKNDKYVTIKNNFGSETTPLYISFKNPEPIVGYEAIKDFEVDPEFVFYDLIKIITTKEYEQNRPFSISPTKIITLKTHAGIYDVDLEFLMSIVMRMVKSMIKNATNEEPDEIEIEFNDIRESMKLIEIVKEACKVNGMKAKIKSAKNMFSWFLQKMFSKDSIKKEKGRSISC